ncbi:hypothetical protein D9758_017716 [Tetrapyrgos nigripes]|uniref:Uncharacterized protein n=1 Tax=Tetrapyrgos nigripes TaxID=182062 RepID=A0A8H5BBI6_9AGAR|nr:hypothetical protein D9758_017716 [Tetrapyrgos nigripes]
MLPSFLTIHVLFLIGFGSFVKAEVPSNAAGGEFYGPDADGICHQGDVIVPCPNRPKGVKLRTPIIIGIVAAIVLVLVLISAFLIWRRRIRALNSAGDNSHFDFVSTSGASNSKISTVTISDWPQPPATVLGARWNMADLRRSSRIPQVDVEMGPGGHRSQMSIGESVSGDSEGLKKSNAYGAPLGLRFRYRLYEKMRYRGRRKR